MVKDLSAGTCNLLIVCVCSARILDNLHTCTGPCHRLTGENVNRSIDDCYALNEHYSIQLAHARTPCIHLVVQGVTGFQVGNAVTNRHLVTLNF